MDYRNYITIEQNKRGGKPCVRGLRIKDYSEETLIKQKLYQGEIIDPHLQSLFLGQLGQNLIRPVHKRIHTIGIEAFLSHQSQIVDMMTN